MSAGMADQNIDQDVQITEQLTLSAEDGGSGITSRQLHHRDMDSGEFEESATAGLSATSSDSAAVHREDHGLLSAAAAGDASEQELQGIGILEENVAEPNHLLSPEESAETAAVKTQMEEGGMVNVTEFTPGNKTLSARYATLCASLGIIPPPALLGALSEVNFIQDDDRGQPREAPNVVPGRQTEQLVMLPLAQMSDAIMFSLADFFRLHLASDKRTEAALVFNTSNEGAPPAGSGAALLHLLRVLGTDLRSVELSNMALGRDTFRDLFHNGLMAHTLGLAFCRVRKLDLVGPFPYLKSLVLDHNPAITFLPEGCFSGAPMLSSISLCATGITNPWATTAALAALPHLRQLRFQRCGCCSDSTAHCPLLASQLDLVAAAAAAAAAATAAASGPSLNGSTGAGDRDASQSVESSASGMFSGVIARGDAGHRRLPHAAGGGRVEDFHGAATTGAEWLQGRLAHHLAALPLVPGRQDMSQEADDLRNLMAQLSGEQLPRLEAAFQVRDGMVEYGVGQETDEIVEVEAEEEDDDVEGRVGFEETEEDEDDDGDDEGQEDGIVEVSHSDIDNQGVEETISELVLQDAAIGDYGLEFDEHMEEAWELAAAVDAAHLGSFDGSNVRGSGTTLQTANHADGVNVRADADAGDEDEAQPSIDEQHADDEGETGRWFRFQDHLGLIRRRIVFGESGGAGDSAGTDSNEDLALSTHVSFSQEETEGRLRADLDNGAPTENPSEEGGEGGEALQERTDSLTYSLSGSDLELQGLVLQDSRSSTLNSSESGTSRISSLSSGTSTSRSVGEPGKFVGDASEAPSPAAGPLETPEATLSGPPGGNSPHHTSESAGPWTAGTPPVCQGVAGRLATPQRTQTPWYTRGQTLVQGREGGAAEQLSRSPVQAGSSTPGIVLPNSLDSPMNNGMLPLEMMEQPAAGSSVGQLAELRAQIREQEPQVLAAAGEEVAATLAGADARMAARERGMGVNGNVPTPEARAGFEAAVAAAGAVPEVGVGSLQDAGSDQLLTYFHQSRLRHSSPICLHQHYREFLLVRLPRLEVLDNVGVTQTERCSAWHAFSQHFEPVPYGLPRAENILTLLQRREMQVCSPVPPSARRPRRFRPSSVSEMTSATSQRGSLVSTDAPWPTRIPGSLSSSSSSSSTTITTATTTSNRMHPKGTAAAGSGPEISQPLLQAQGPHVAASGSAAAASATGVGLSSAGRQAMPVCTEPRRGGKSSAGFRRVLGASRVQACNWLSCKPMTCAPESQTPSASVAAGDQARRYRPRQFEYHPTDPNLMVFGTLHGEVVVVNHEAEKIVGQVHSIGAPHSILGLCWLNKDPSKLIGGCDNGSIQLYDINHMRACYLASLRRPQTSQSPATAGLTPPPPPAHQQQQQLLQLQPTARAVRPPPGEGWQHVPTDPVQGRGPEFVLGMMNTRVGAGAPGAWTLGGLTGAARAPLSVLSAGGSSNTWSWGTVRSPAIYTYEDFEQLTSVHVNCTDDVFVASGYSNHVGLYDLRTGKRLHVFPNLHQEHINVLKFSHHSPHLFATSSFDRDIKLWDARQRIHADGHNPIYSVRSKRGNVMVCFSPDDHFLLASAIDNEVRQYVASDGRLQMTCDIAPVGSQHNYTRSYYMNGRDYIVSGSCEENIVRICCARTGRRLRDVVLEGKGGRSSLYVQSLRGDPFRDFHLSVLVAYSHPNSRSEIVKVNLVSNTSSRSGHSSDLQDFALAGVGA